GRDKGLVAARRSDGPHSASRPPRYSLFSRWWSVIGGRPGPRPCRRNEDRPPHRRGPIEGLKLRKNCLHFGGAARHALSWLHADRRAAAAGATRRARRRV